MDILDNILHCDQISNMNRSLAAVACLATLAIAHAAPVMEASIFEVDVTPTECVSCMLKGEHTRPFSESVV
jgi:hypothetical protein